MGLHWWTGAVPHACEGASGGVGQVFITFHSAGLGFALRMDEVDEVISVENLRKLRGARPWVIGVLIREGKIVGVVDPARIVGKGAGTGKEILILRGEPGLGLLAERTDALVRDYSVEEGGSSEAGPIPGCRKVLRFPSGTFMLLELPRLRKHLGAQPT